MNVAEKTLQLKQDFDEVYEAGWEKYRSNHWDIVQANGERTNYSQNAHTGFFNGNYYDFLNFYPKHDICPVGDASHLFYTWRKDNHSGSLSKRLKECGVVLDTSQATTLRYAFAYSYISEIPTIDFTGITLFDNNTGVFMDTYGFVKIIEKIIVKEDLTYASWFRNCAGLKSITVEGVIGNQFDISSASILEVDSAKSIITHLKNYKGTEYELTYSVLFHANVWALLDAEGNASPNGNTWAEYVADLGWGA